MTTLILEGGGMRTAFTAGVLDCFIDKQLMLRHIIGVSTSTYSALSYLSKQREHTIDVYTTFCRDKRFRSTMGTLSGRGMNMVSVINDAAGRLPFENKQLLNSQAFMTAVVTNCLTGEAAYFPIRDLQADQRYAMAAVSYPLVSPAVEVNGVPYFDGCITAPIPVEYAQKQGYKKYIFVLTEDRTYYQKKIPMLGLVRKKYQKFPRLLESLECQHIRYNQQLEMAYSLERMGKAIILQPSEPAKISVSEKNPKKILSLYNEGYLKASENFDTLSEFLTPIVKDA